MKNEGKKVLISACDTFRAGAVEQLEKWGENSGVDMIKADKEGMDPSAVAYKALEKAVKDNYDVLLIDTAGRMHNNINLMQELEKIDRVLKKIVETGADEKILVLDATLGQNTKKQVEMFNKVVNISGIIMNKMDGTAKGGILIPIFNEFKKPIYAIGIGEQFDDLQKLPKDLSDIKSLYLCDKSSEADFSKQLELLGKDLNYINENVYVNLDKKLSEIKKMLTALIKKLKNS